MKNLLVGIIVVAFFLLATFESDVKLAAGCLLLGVTNAVLFL